MVVEVVLRGPAVHQQFDRTVVLTINVVDLVFLSYGRQGRRFAAPPKAPNNPNVSDPLSSFSRASVGLSGGAGSTAVIALNE